MTAAQCPRCDSTMQPSENGGGILQCSMCGGSFIPASETEPVSESEAPATEAVTEATGSGEAPMTNCPVCHVRMRADRIADAALFRCESCLGVWADGIAAGVEAHAGVAESVGVRRRLIYALTLPERVLRSTVGVTAGAAKEAAEFLIPSAFQNSKTYEVVVRNSLRFLTEDIGGVARQDGAEDLGKDFAARKAVGNFVDLAGWATLAFSPVWMMAVVSDVAYGSKSYVRELADELKSKGLIDENSTINNIDDVLNAVQDASGKAASLVDTPPLSVEQLRDSLNQTRAAVASADYRGVLPEAELKAYWQEMRDIARREDVSLIGVSGALTMHTLGKVGNVSRGTLAGVQVAGGIFNKVVIGHYVESLKTVRERGFYQTVRESSRPYIEAVWSNFAAEKKTWTEELVSGRAFGGAFRAVRNFFSRPNEAPKAGGPSPTGSDDADDASA